MVLGFSLCVDLIPYRVCVLYAALNVFVFLIPNWLVLGKSASHEENGGHLVLFHHSSLVVHFDHYRDVGTAEVGLSGFFFYMPKLLCLSTSLDISNPFGLNSAFLGAKLCYLLGLVGYFWMVEMETSRLAVLLTLGFILCMIRMNFHQL